MRIIFMGTPAFVVPVLEALLGAGHRVVGVYTQQDKPAGRGRQAEAPPVKVYALDKGLPVFQPRSLRRPEAVTELKALAPDAIVVAAYGKLLPPEVLAIPPLGCLNLHPSLLPRHRGPSPVVWTILEGDEETGMTIILLDEGMDTGPLLAQQREPVRPEDTSETLTRHLFQIGAHLVAETLPQWARREIQPVPQDHSRATTTRLLEKEDGLLDFQQPAEVLWRKVRAFQPWPGAYTRWHGQLLKVLEALPLPMDTALIPGAGQEPPPGTVVALRGGHPAPAAVVAGAGVLGLLRLHLEGKRPVACREFLGGQRGFVGARLPC
ncbi:MAG: methionyl-tRNA formyltransferase [Chloroflexi bacterium]|nr:methionyl-tRNA formyltransferase [Chloroflexota bacterium]